jgi:hypothetical protein
LARSGYFYWITPATRAPNLIAQFTVTHTKRSQMTLSLGLGAAGSSTPSTTWSTGALSADGGAYAFDGTTVPVSGTFALDFSDLNPNPAPGSSGRYFLNLTDSVSGDPLSISSLRLLDGAGTVLAQSSNASTSIDGATFRSFVDYTAPGTGNILPIASGKLFPSSGEAPLLVSFDATGSSDQDGSLIDYSWDFGDGSYGTGALVSHTYVAPGSFVPRLTVTDDKGASANVTFGVVVTDPNALNAPSALSAIASPGAVNLTWADNSNNEDGFVVERAAKSKSMLTFSVLATLPADSKSYSDTAVSARATYVYRVRGVKSSLLSDPSNQVQVRAK